MAFVSLERPASLFVAGAVLLASIKVQIAWQARHLVRCRTVRISPCMAGASFGGVARVMKWFVLQRVPTRVSDKSLRGMSHKGVSEARLPKVCYRSVLEGCFKERLRRVFARDAHKSVSEGCRQIVSSQECPSLMWFEKLPSPKFPWGKFCFIRA